MSKTAKRRRQQPSAVRSSARPGSRAAAATSLADRSRRRPPAVRHVAVGMLAAVFVGLFWASRPEWDGEMRLWKAVGDAAFLLLLVTLSLGPLSRVARPVTRALAWRRQFGIWFALVAGLHGVLVVHGWARWSLRRFLGYEIVPQLGREARLEPGFGLANLIGLTALVFALVLAATSSDLALRRLGASAWKWLHHSALFIFYLSLLHAGYFLFLHYIGLVSQTGAASGLVPVPVRRARRGAAGAAGSCLRQDRRPRESPDGELTVFAMRRRRAVFAVAGGLLIGASLPPVGVWPLALAGIVLVDRGIADAPMLSRFRRGWMTGIALLAPTTWWMRELTLPGWLLTSLVLGAFLGAALAAVPPRAGRWVALPGAWVLFEAVRGRWPFGGVPLSTLAVGQVGGPFAPIARVGGPLLLAAVTVAAAAGVAAALARRPRSALTAAAAVVAVVTVAVFAPDGAGSGRVLDADVVQGGGPQGTQAINTDATEVLQRHLEASRGVRRRANLVVWPEDVVDVDAPFGASAEAAELAALSRRLEGVLVVGVTEQTGTRFTNEAIAIADGAVEDRVGKERRVPFGEYVPFRSVIEPLAPDALPHRDAIVSRGPAVLDTSVGRLGVVISWEVFFPDRAREAIRNGGQLLLNPTNGSSFTGTQVQSQQVASSRLRAIETGRWVLQAAPTGFSAVIAPNGAVLARTGVSERTVLRATVELRSGRTWAVAFGDSPTLALAAGLLTWGWRLARRAEVP